MIEATYTKRTGIIIILFLNVLSIYSQISLFSNEDNILLSNSESLSLPMDLDFLLYDGADTHITMRASSLNTISSLRFIKRAVDTSIENKWISTLVYTPLLVFSLPYTHEEAHRSILTYLGIGSINQPYIFSGNRASVIGVSDSALQNLRDNQFDYFIRLHTAGIESDYMISLHEKELVAFGEDSFRNIGFNILLRDISIIFYGLEGLIAYYKQDESTFTEEVNELNRDIVGQDIYGMVYHLYQPDTPYNRYKSFSNLTDEGKELVKRIGWRSFLNLASPYLLNHPDSFNLSENLNISCNLGYSLSPFGDFIDEILYVHYRGLKFNLYLRQYQNKSNWFPAMGLSLVNYEPTNILSFSTRIHLWMQPENLDFNTSEADFGFAIEGEGSFFISHRSDKILSDLNALGFSLGARYKTYGFLPEVESHEENFSLNTGIILRY